MSSSSLSQSQEQCLKRDLHHWLKDGQPLDNIELHGNLIGLHLPKVNLTGANLEDADLRYADLAGVILQEAILKGANLQGAKLKGANLSRANLEGAHLENADLSRTILAQASFIKADLRYASLNSADIAGTDFTQADLRWANMFSCTGSLSAKFDNADLRWVRGEYSGLDQQELSRVGAKVEGIRGVPNCLFDLPFAKVSEEPHQGILHRIIAIVRRSK